MTADAAAAMCARSVAAYLEETECDPEDAWVALGRMVEVNHHASGRSGVLTKEQRFRADNELVEIRWEGPVQRARPR